MTVAELKQLIEKVPDDMPVEALYISEVRRNICLLPVK